MNVSMFVFLTACIEESHVGDVDIVARFVNDLKSIGVTIVLREIEGTMTIVNYSFVISRFSGFDIPILKFQGSVYGIGNVG